MISFKPDDLINHIFLTVPNENGQRFRAKIVQKIVEHEESLQQEPKHIKFLVSAKGSKADEIVAYNNILDYLEEALSDDPTEQMWRFMHTKVLLSPRIRVSRDLSTLS